MAVTKIAARDWTFEVDDGLGTATYLEIGGIKTFTPSASSTEADAKDFDSAGVDEHLIMSRGYELKLEGNYLEDPSDGSRNAGQERVEAVAELTGPSSLVPWRVTSPGGTTWEFDGSAVMDNVGGGGVEEISGWGVTIKRSGATTTTTP